MSKTSSFLSALYLTHCRHLSTWWCLQFHSVLAEWSIRVPMQHLKRFGSIRKMGHLWSSVTKNNRSSKGTKWVFWIIVFCEFASNSGYLNWHSKQSSKQQASLRLEKKVRRSSALRCWGNGVHLRKVHFTIPCCLTDMYYCSLHIWTHKSVLGLGQEKNLLPKGCWNRFTCTRIC